MRRTSYVAAVAYAGWGLSRWSRRSAIEELKTLSAAEIEARLPHPRTLLPEMPADEMVDEETAGRIRNGTQVRSAGVFECFTGEGVYSAARFTRDYAAIAVGTLMQPIVVLGLRGYFRNIGVMRPSG